MSEEMLCGAIRCRYFGYTIEYIMRHCEKVEDCFQRTGEQVIKEALREVAEEEKQRT